MNRILSIAITVMLFHSITFSQIIAISGKVKDSNTGLAIAGATLKIGNNGASTDKTGEFNLVIEKSIVMQYGISVSCIGYQKKNLAFKPGSYYQVSLQPALTTLKEINISADGESIIQKAIRRIPQNYPVKDFMMEGFLRVYHVANDTTAYYKYYSNDAVIRLYYPSYLDKNKPPQVALIENKPVTLRNLKSDKDTVRWVNSYLIVASDDLVHNRSGLLNASHTGKYKYVVDGKDQVNGSRVYVINYFSAEKNDETGTLYIDTASYAIVEAEITRYNVKHFPFINLNKTSRIINYKKLNGRWYLDNIKINISTKHSGVDLYGSIDYKTIAIDSVNVQPLSYHDAIQGMSEDSRINNAGTPETRAKYAGFFKSAAADTSMAHIAVPVIDTVKPKNKIPKNPFKALLGYLTGDNLRYGFAIAKLPVTISQNQPVLGADVDGIANYALAFNLQLRLFKELFFETDNEFNWGIGGLSNNSDNFILTYNFPFNKGYHPITLSPMFGYYNLKLSKNNTDYYKQQNLVYGLSIAYELSHRWSYYIAGKYYSGLSTENYGVNLNEQKITITTGFIYKLK